MAFEEAPPGQAPTEQEIRNFFNNRIPVNLGTITSTKLLIFECHTLVVANIKPEVHHNDESASHFSLPSAERDRRLTDQKKRLSAPLQRR
jgi:hypothetical protein